MTYDRVVVPSYQRAETCRDKTLALLADRGQDPARVDVVVADEQQAELYADTLHPGTYGQLVVAVPGMGAVRNWITDHYPDGHRLVMVDDDLSDVKRRVNAKLLEPVANVTEVWAEGFYYADQAGARLWGVYPVANAMFMKPRVTTDLRYIVGCLWGVTNSHTPEAHVTLDDKEDFERTLLYYLADGAVARVEWYCPVTRYYREPGGMQVERTPERVEASARELVARYPELCQLNTAKKGGHVEVKLRDRRPR